MGPVHCKCSGQHSREMADHELLDIEEWELVLSKMLKFHFNISEEIKAVVQAIRQEMKPELIPLAEDKATFGKLVKKAIRRMWSLEYEVDELQHKFADSIGKMDLDNLKKTYGDAIKDLEPMRVPRPAKTPAAPEKP